MHPSEPPRTAGAGSRSGGLAAELRQVLFVLVVAVVFVMVAALLDHRLHCGEPGETDGREAPGSQERPEAQPLQRAQMAPPSAEAAPPPHG